MERLELRKLALALDISVIIGFAGLTSAWGACSSALLADMQQRGVPDDVVKKECGIPGNAPVPSSDTRGSRCETQKGSCPLEYAARVGAPCWCNTIGGQIPGEAK
jgi:hypothetical protein